MVIENELCARGVNLTLHEARALERRLERDALDLDARLMLIGFYETRSQHRKSKYEHVLWVIKHRPETPLGVHGHVPPSEDALAIYQEGKRCYYEAVQAHPDNPMVAANAAFFVVLFEASLGEELLIDGKAHNPGHAEWPAALGRFYELLQIGKEPSEQIRLGTLALDNFLEAFALETDDVHALSMLWSMRQCAASALRTDAVRLFRLADGVGNEASRTEDRSERCAALTTARGLVALVANDVVAAERFLKESVDALKGGPRMELARELLSRGATEVVAAYLHACAQVLGADASRLEALGASIRRGEIMELENLEGRETHPVSAKP